MDKRILNLLPISKTTNGNSFDKGYNRAVDEFCADFHAFTALNEIGIVPSELDICRIIDKTELSGTISEVEKCAKAIRNFMLGKES